jgi:hypothetical protein
MQQIVFILYMFKQDWITYMKYTPFYSIDSTWIYWFDTGFQRRERATRDRTFMGDLRSPQQPMLSEYIENILYLLLCLAHKW